MGEAVMAVLMVLLALAGLMLARPSEAERRAVQAQAWGRLEAWELGVRGR